MVDGCVSRINPKLEYTDQEVRFASPLGGNPVAVLTGAEQAAFDAQGCGIDWREERDRNLQTMTRAHVRPFIVATCVTARRARAAMPAGRVMRTAASQRLLMEAPASSYDQIPYLSLAFPQTHPDRLATIGANLPAVSA